MVQHHSDVLKEYPRMSEWDQLEEAKQRCQNELPSRFEKWDDGSGGNLRTVREEEPPVRRQNAVGRPSWSTNGARSNTPEAKFSKIPKEDQDAYHRAARMMETQSGGKKKFTIQEFMSEYE